MLPRPKARPEFMSIPAPPYSRRRFVFLWMAMNDPAAPHCLWFGALRAWQTYEQVPAFRTLSLYR
jgi:hypothetical protein